MTQNSGTTIAATRHVVFRDLLDMLPVASYDQARRFISNLGLVPPSEKLSIPEMPAVESEKGAVKPSDKRVVVASYPYTTEHGVLLYENVRYEPKDFRQRHYINGRAVWGLGDVERVPYRLPDLYRKPSGSMVFLCEGEKDADVAADIGLFASNAKNWQRDWNIYLHSSDRIVVLADHDAAGIRQAEKTAAVVGSELRNVQLLDFFRDDASPSRDRNDLSDWVRVLRADGMNDAAIREKLIALAKERFEAAASSERKMNSLLMRFIRLCVTPDISETAYSGGDQPEIERWLNRTYGERLECVSGFYRRTDGTPFRLNLPFKCALSGYKSAGGFFDGILCQPFDSLNKYFLLSSAKFGGPKAIPLRPRDQQYFTQYKEVRLRAA